FILFKTKILLEEAKGDPVKKAALIKDIVSSISRIYDPIKRSVYIRECADRLNINEQLLVDSVNKTVRQSLSKKKEKELTNQFKRNFPDKGPPNYTEQNAPAVQEPVKKSTKASNDEFQERDIIRLLVEFSDRVLEEDLTVTYYVLANMEDIIEEFDSEFYKSIIQDCMAAISRKETVNKNYFLTHENKDIQQLAINLLATPYSYSENWAEKGNPLQSQKAPDENYKKDTINGIDRFKFRKVMRLCVKNQKKLEKWATEKDKSADAQIEEIKTLRVHMKLLELRKQLGERVGTYGAIK
ncbi:MAG: hypothetical protein AAFV80_07740, partial [Bacteroidota bacterium]